MVANLASTAAAHTGKAGAELTVSAEFEPAWHGRLELGTVTAAFNAVRVRFWARAASMC